MWLFASGPLGAEHAARVAPRGQVVFPGALDPAELTVRERALRWTPAGRATLPAGDYRDWDEIRAWAGSVGETLRATRV